MKSVPVLGSLLLLAVALLAMVIATDIEDGWFAAAGKNTIVAAVPHETALQVGGGAEGSNRCLSEPDLRRIVREELAAYPAPIAAARAPGSPGVEMRHPGAPRTSIEFERIDRQVDEYIRAGAISEAEMSALQDEMSRLDPAARRQILGKIVRAINSGALAGNL